MPEKGHTHNTRERRKQLERNERKQEQKNKNFDYKTIKLPQNDKQLIVAINDKTPYRGGTTVKVIEANGKGTDINNPVHVFIPGKCRLNKRKKQNVNNKQYLFVEIIDIPIYTSAGCRYSLIHAYNDDEIKD